MHPQLANTAMTSSANVRSVDAIHQFRAATVGIGDSIAAALDDLRMQINRTLQWIDHDVAAYWKEETRRCFNRVAEARTHLANRQRANYSGSRAACVDEKLALQKAKRKLEEATAKQKTVRRWGMKLHQAADLFSTRLARCDHLVHHDLPKLHALLDRMLTALHEYVTVPTNEVQRAQGEESEAGATKSQ